MVLLWRPEERDHRKTMPIALVALLPGLDAEVTQAGNHPLGSWAGVGKNLCIATHVRGNSA